MPHEMPASKAIINNPVLVDSNPAVDAWNQISMAVLAESFLQFRRKPYLVFHCYSSCHLYVFV